MLHLLGLALVCLTAAPPPGPITLQRQGEITLPSHTSGIHGRWVGPQRYIELGRELQAPPKRRRFPVPIYLLGDVLERKVLKVPVRIPDYPAGEVLYFREDLMLLFFRASSSAGSDSNTFCLWNPQEKAECVPKELGPYGKPEKSQLFYPIGADPTEKSFYFAMETRDTPSGPNSRSGPLSLKLLRLSLTQPSMAIEWETELTLPKRPQQLELSERVFSADGKKLALAEYHDLTDEPRYSPTPPPQVYVIDLETKKTQTFPISFTPYGLAFSRDGRYLAVGSHQTGEIVRINLKQGKIDARVKAEKTIKKFFPSPKGSSFLVFYSSFDGSKPLEVRRWKDLKATGKIPIPPLLPELVGPQLVGVKAPPDGRLLVFSVEEKKGAPESETQVVFEVRER